MAINKVKNDDEIFQESVRFHQSGKLNDARKGFECLIKKYPNTKANTCVPLSPKKAKFWWFKNKKNIREIKKIIKKSVK